MRDTAREVRVNSWVTYSGGPLHMDEQSQEDKLEPTYNSFVPILDIALKTCGKQWLIENGGKKGSGISVLMAWNEDNDDIYIYIYIYIYTFKKKQNGSH